MVAGIYYIWHFFLLVFFPHDIYLYLDVVRMPCISVDFIVTTNTTCGLVQLATYERRALDFVALFAFNLLVNAR